jgi:hypothetical protein
VTAMSMMWLERGMRASMPPCWIGVAQMAMLIVRLFTICGVCLTCLDSGAGVTPGRDGHWYER